MKKILADRMPSTQQMMQVFSLAAFIIYTWAAYRTFWKFPSWILTLPVSEIGALISYSLTFSFLESLFIFIPILFLGIILPKRIFTDQFTVRGSIIVLFVLGSMMLHLYWYSTDDSERVAFAESVRLWWAITFFLALIAIWLLPKLKIIAWIIQEISDRTIIFLYIFVPLSAIGFIYVVIRNLFLV